MPGNMQAPGRSADRSPVKSRKGRAIPVGQGPVAQGLVQSGQGSAGRGGFMSPGSNAKHAMLPVNRPTDHTAPQWRGSSRSERKCRHCLP